MLAHHPELALEHVASGQVIQLVNPSLVGVGVGDIIWRIVISADGLFRGKAVGEAETAMGAVEKGKRLPAREVIYRVKRFLYIGVAAGGATGKGNGGHIGAIRDQKYDYSWEGQSFPRFLFPAFSFFRLHALSTR